MQLNVDIQFADRNYRAALAHSGSSCIKQQPRHFAQAQVLKRRQASNERIIAVSRTEIAQQMKQNESQMSAATGILTTAMGVIDALNQAFVELSVTGRMATLQAQINQALQNHQDSLQGDFYIRPRYEHGQGWSTTLVNLETGKRADILSSPDTQVLAESAANLPAFAIDESGMRIISIGLGMDPSKIERYKPRTARNMGAWWGKQDVPYPSLLAFDSLK